METCITADKYTVSPAYYVTMISSELLNRVCSLPQGEYLTELHTEPHFLSDVIYGRLDETRLNTFTPVLAGLVHNTWPNGPYINRRIRGDPIGGGARLANANWPSVASSRRMAGSDTQTTFGSSTPTLTSLRTGSIFFLLSVLTLPSFLSFFLFFCWKSYEITVEQVWVWRRWNRGPLAESCMTIYVTNMTNPNRALTRLRSVITVFRYLNAERRTLRAQYREISNERWIVNQAWNLANPTQTLDIRPIWAAWFRNHVNGMIKTSISFLNRWPDTMENNWRGRTGPVAERVMGDIGRLRTQIRNGAVNIRIDDF